MFHVEEDVSKYINLWKSVSPSVCLLQYSINGQRIASGSGFKIGDKLITNNHVIQAPTNATIDLIFVDSDGHNPKYKISMDVYAFQKLLLDGEPEESWDYAIIDISKLGFDSIPSLKLGSNRSPSIGMETVLFGYQFDQPNLSMHRGIVSSKFVLAGVKYIQPELFTAI